MSKKILTDLANTMPQMIASRMHLDDWETLAALPDGVLTIDMLTNSARHSCGEHLHLRVVADLVSWITGRLAAARLTLLDLSKAELIVVIRTNRAPVDRTQIIPFDFSCTSFFDSKGQVFKSIPASTLRWYTRHKGV